MRLLPTRRARRVTSIAALVCAWLLACAPAFALDPQATFDHYRLDRWGVAEGLPQISVLSITQGPLGYLWLGLETSVARFDGTRFTVYDFKTTGVDTSFATRALAASDGMIWFGTPRGVLRFDGEHVVAMDVGGKPVGVLDLAQAADGRVLAATDSGVYAVGNGRLQAVPGLRDPALSLQRDGDDVWIGGIGAVTRLHARKPERMALRDPTLKILHIVRDGDALWLGTQSGLRRYDPRIGALEVVADAGGESVESLLDDSDGNLWVGTVDRLLRRHPDGRWEIVQARDLFARPWVDSIFEDREGGLWLGTHYESLVRLRDSAISRIGEREGLADPFAWSVLRARDGRLLIGTNDGLVAVGDDGVPKRIVAGAQLPQAQVYTLAEDPDGTLWIGTRGGLAIWRNGSFLKTPALAPLAGVQINVVRRVGDDDHWIGTMRGLYRFRGGVLRAVGLSGGVPAAEVRTILPQTPDDVLIGTGAGIYRVRGERISRLPGATALDRTTVMHLAWLRPGMLGITTVGRGIGLLRDGRLLLLGPGEGIPSPTNWSLDAIGAYLYVASIDGAWRIALSDLPDPSAQPPFRLRAQVVVESSQRGSGGHRYGCCNGGGDARTLREGKVLWVASSAGAVRLDTAALPAPAAPPTARIERVFSGGKIYPGDRELKLDSEHRDPSIQFTGLSLVDSDRLEFRYMLEGYDARWSEASTQRVAHYTHLPPGDYRFSVQARAPFGAWGPQVAPLPIRVLPRWYERGAVRLGMALLSLLLVVAAVWRHNAGLRRRARELQQAVDERTAALREANARLEDLTRTDSLTGLGNRRALDTASAHPGRNWNGALLMIDLDHFKRVNDEHGHERGDQVLVALSEILREHTRVEDLVLRWGGEEFLIALRRLGMDAALAIAERIRQEMEQRRFRSHDGEALRVTCSIGIAAMPAHAAREGDLEAGIALADFALYRAKNLGRNRVCAAVLPAQATPGIAQGDLREEAERLDAAGLLQWREPNAAGV